MDDNSNQCSQNDNHNSHISTPPKASLREFMNRKKQRLETPLQNNCSFLQEFNFYEKSCQRSERLELLYQALRSVKPTSVESERCFSGLGQFLTKFRTRLSD